MNITVAEYKAKWDRGVFAGMRVLATTLEKFPPDQWPGVLAQLKESLETESGRNELRLKADEYTALENPDKDGH